MPNNFSGNSKIYEEIENDILNKICAPLGLLGVEFDRMLYQNYMEIMKINYWGYTLRDSPNHMNFATIRL